MTDEETAYGHFMQEYATVHTTNESMDLMHQPLLVGCMGKPIELLWMECEEGT
jgi:hypothetical protein